MTLLNQTVTCEAQQAVSVVSPANMFVALLFIFSGAAVFLLILLGIRLGPNTEDEMASNTLTLKKIKHDSLNLEDSKRSSLNPDYLKRESITQEDSKRGSLVIENPKRESITLG
jgi:hypothetical protein